MASVSGIKLGKAFVEITALDRTQKVIASVSKKMSAFAARMGQMGRNLLAGSVVGLAPVAFSAKAFADFDDSLRKVEARSSGTAEQMEALRNQAKQLGRETSFTATEVGSLQAKVAQKGFDRAQILGMTESIVSLGKAAGEGEDGMTDLVESADLVTGAIRAYRLEAKDASMLSDLFTTAVNNSNFTLQDLIVSFSNAAPIAKQYNLGVKDTVATLAAMRNVNIDAASSGVALRNMFSRMTKEANRSKFNELMKEATGKTIEFADASGNLRKPAEILAEIGKATKGLNTIAKGNIFEALLGIRQVTKGGAIAEGATDIEALLKKFDQMEGQAKKTAKIMDAGLGGSMRRTLSAIDGVKIAIGEALQGSLVALEPTITSILGKMTAWVERNGEAVKSFVKILAIIGGVGAGLLTLSLMLKGIVFALGGLAAILKVVGVLFSFILSPIGLATAGIVGFIAAFAGFDGIVNFFKNIFAWIKKAIGVIQVFSTDWSKAFEIIKLHAQAAFLDMVAIAKNIFANIGKLLKDFVMDSISVIKGINAALVATEKTEKLQKEAIKIRKEFRERKKRAGLESVGFASEADRKREKELIDAANARGGTSTEAEKRELEAIDARRDKENKRRAELAKKLFSPRELAVLKEVEKRAGKANTESADAVNAMEKAFENFGSNLDKNLSKMFEGSKEGKLLRKRAGELFEKMAEDAKKDFAVKVAGGGDGPAIAPDEEGGGGKATLDSVSSSVAMLPPTLNDGLVRGSIEAARQAAQNRFGKQKEDKALGVAEDSLAELRAIRAGIEEGADGVWLLPQEATHTPQ